MTRLARWCFHHRRTVVAGWLLAVVTMLGLSQGLGSHFNSNFNLPNTDSQAAVSLLTKNFPAASGEGDQIVIQATHGATIRSASVEGPVTAALAKVANVPGVETVGSPYTKAGAAQISRDGTVAFATVTWDKKSANVTKTDAKSLIAAAESADGANVHVSLGGQSITNSENSGTGLSVGVGVLAALVILLIVFGGAVLAALMPLLAAALALVIATQGIGLLSHAFDVASVATELAILIGLGVGVDYGLFIISRHRTALKTGLSYEDAVAQAVNTSGRTVLFAGIDGVHRPARPVRPRRHLPLRAIDLLGHRGGLHHGHLPDLPARHARLRRPQGPVPPGTGRPGPRHHTGERRRLLAAMGEGSSKPARSSSRSRPWASWSPSPCPSSACGSARPTPAPTRPLRPPTRPTRRWPTDSDPGSTVRSSSPPRYPAPPTRPPSTSS